MCCGVEIENFVHGIAEWMSEMNEAITSLPPPVKSQEFVYNHSQSSNLSETFFKVYHQAVCHSFEALEHILWFVGLYAIICLIVYLLIFCKWTVKWCRNATNVRFPNCKRVLVVTAHPDDESMFFGPTILSLTKRKDCRVYLLCLSNGLYTNNMNKFLCLSFVFDLVVENCSIWMDF